jgi:hypothetical protein
VKVYPSPEIIPGLDTVLVGEVEEHALAVHLPKLPTVPFSIHECGYSDII